MKVLVLTCCLLALAMAAPVRKARDLSSGSSERYSRFFQPFYPPYFPFPPFFNRPPFYQPFPRYPPFPGFNYPGFANIPVFNGFERRAIPGASKVRGNNVEESAPQEFSLINGASISSEVSLEDTSSIEDNDYRLSLVNVPHDLPDYGDPRVSDYGHPRVPDYGHPRVPDYGHPRVPDYGDPRVPDYDGAVTPDEELPGVPDYEVPFGPGVDTDVDIGFDQQSSRDTANEGSNTEEPTGVLPYSDSSQNLDSLGLTQEDNQMTRDSNEGAGHHEAVNEPTEQDLNHGETLNTQEFVDQQGSSEDLTEESQTDETQNVDANPMDTELTAYEDDSYEDDADIGFIDNNHNYNGDVESEFNGADSNQRTSSDSDETDLDAGEIEFNDNDGNAEDSSEDVTNISNVEDDSVLGENSETNFSI
ncbi:uncharacterized protein LOC127586706 isoform X2 [Pristis pectinata]|uniref:uncharacterized protein LOC127586706 isoform X2 n=1 Tax=Pristis pectinata TaxID=685728 RepID=UPI00223E6245|nr:uncharacterized protein LOC127586706 isoform X2 [Pristis pectinata]